jgi:hypothetical protein
VLSLTGEARALLLSIGPLAELALTQEQLHARLRELTPAVSPELEAAWQAAAEAVLRQRPEPGHQEVKLGAEQFLVLVTCRDEKHQLEVLGRLQADGRCSSFGPLVAHGRSPRCRNPLVLLPVLDANARTPDETMNTAGGRAAVPGARLVTETADTGGKGRRGQAG